MQVCTLFLLSFLTVLIKVKLSFVSFSHCYVCYACLLSTPSPSPRSGGHPSTPPREGGGGSPYWPTPFFIVPEIEDHGKLCAPIRDIGGRAENWRRDVSEASSGRKTKVRVLECISTEISYYDLWHLTISL